MSIGYPPGIGLAAHAPYFQGTGYSLSERPRRTLRKQVFPAQLSVDKCFVQGPGGVACLTAGLARREIREFYDLRRSQIPHPSSLKKLPGQRGDPQAARIYPNPAKGSREWPSTDGTTGPLEEEREGEREGSGLPDGPEDPSAPSQAAPPERVEASARCKGKENRKKGGTGRGGAFLLHYVARA